MAVPLRIGSLALLSTCALVTLVTLSLRNNNAPPRRCLALESLFQELPHSLLCVGVLSIAYHRCFSTTFQMLSITNHGALSQYYKSGTLVGLGVP